MLHKAIGHAQVQYRTSHIGRGQNLQHHGSKAALKAEIFQRNQKARMLCRPQQHFPIHGLHKPRVNHAAADPVSGQDNRGPERVFHHAAHGQNDHLAALDKPLPAAHLQIAGLAHAFAQILHGLSITDGHGAIHLSAELHHALELMPVPGQGNGHIGRMAQIAQGVHPLMGGAILAHQSSPIHHQTNRQLIQADIVQNLIVRALQKRGVYPKIRPHARGRHAGRQGDRMLLGNAHIEKTLRKNLFKFVQPGSAGHGRGNGHNPAILFGQLHQLARHNAAIGLYFFAHDLAAVHIKGRDPMKHIGMVLGISIAPSLLGDHMQKHRLLTCLGAGQHLDQLF